MQPGRVQIVAYSTIYDIRGDSVAHVQCKRDIRLAVVDDVGTVLNGKVTHGHIPPIGIEDGAFLKLHGFRSRQGIGMSHMNGNITPAVLLRQFQSCTCNDGTIEGILPGKGDMAAGVPLTINQHSIGTIQNRIKRQVPIAAKAVCITHRQRSGISVIAQSAQGQGLAG